MKKKLIAAVSAFILSVTGFLGYVAYSNSQSDKHGEEKLDQAISETITENPELNNPCLGTHVIGSYSYSELAKKTTEEIKQLVKQAPWDC